MFKGIMISLALTTVCSLAWESAGGQTKDPLLFPKDNFIVETKTVKTSAGEKKVTYHSYVHIPYVANPIDKDYQSMNVSVPVKVDDAPVDATNAPILFVIGVGGYMSSNNARIGPGGNSKVNGNADLALAAGYVVVSPGCRGRDNKAADGTYYGKAPAAIVDLKAAVRYIRHNQGVMPGNVNWITFTFADYVTHVGRMKGLPAFDDFNMRQPEPNLFGNKTTEARHFTSFSLRQATGNKTAEIESEVKTLLNMMNAMYFIGQNNKDCVQFWWLRQGTSDNHTSQTVITNLATSLENRNKNVNTWLYWDTGHGADQDPEEFIAWIGKIIGFSKQ